MENVFFGLFLCGLTACFFPPVSGFSDEWLRPKWVLAEVVALLLLMAWGGQAFRDSRSGDRTSLRTMFMKGIFSEAVVVVAFLEAAYVLWKAWHKGGRVMAAGTFDNPAGVAFCLCAALPFYAVVWREWKGVWRLALMVGMTTVVAAILCSQSRTGWICLAMYAVWILPVRWCGNRTGKAVVVAVLAAGLAWAVSAVKSDSTSGRRFILERSWELLKAQPWTGYGPGGFLREYMPAQAHFFREYPDSEYAWLASEVYHPLNEFLLVGVEYGVGGMALVLAVFVGLLVALMRKRSLFAKASATSLCALAIFAMFSYPFKYPLSWVVIGVCGLEACGSFIGRLKADAWRLRLVVLVSLVASFVGLAVVGHAYSHEYRWSRAAWRASHGHSRAMMPEYALLYNYYSRNASFLYNYTAEQFYAGRFEAALATAGECARLWPSYNLSLLAGDICRAAGKTNEAVEYYEQAHWMCPVRFAPLEGLYYSYRDEGEHGKADSVAEVIARKRVKVDGPDVRRIKEEVRTDAEAFRKRNTP